jgi:hypothetical protein
MCDMAKDAYIQCRVDAATKFAVGELADRYDLSESSLLVRWVKAGLGASAVTPSSIAPPVRPAGKVVRVSVRLRGEDQALLKERASARGMPVATYLSILVRTHLRGLPPLPDRELVELKRAVAAVNEIGRNVNQIARVANQSGQVVGLTRSDLRAMFPVFTTLREHFKALINANAASWETGHAEAPHPPKP